jgi:hypothetical protein
VFLKGNAMQKTRIVVSCLLVGALVAVANAQDRGPRTDKVVGLSFHALSGNAAAGYNQANLDGQSYFVAAQPMIRADEIGSVQSGPSSITLSGEFAGAKSGQVGVMADGQLIGVGTLDAKKGQATITGLSAAQTQRVTGLLSRKGGAPTSAAFKIVPAGQANGEYMFDVFAHNIPGLRTYQVKLEATGGSAGSLSMADVRIDEGRQDYVFFGNEAIKAADQSGLRLGGTLFSGGAVDVTTPKYLGTFWFRPSPDAAGTFTINAKMGMESFAQDAVNQTIPVTSIPATVDVGRKASNRANE